MGIIADKIRQAIYGKDVRDSIADGIAEVETLRADYDQQVINAGNSNAEIVAARGGEVSLPVKINKIDSSLSDIVQKQTTQNANIGLKANQSDLLIERERINTFTTLAAGSTTGDAELIDARIGADGVIYDNAGGAIRGQIDKINNDLVVHKEDYAKQSNEGFPSQAKDLKDNKTYTIKLQLSSEGNPQLISKEVI